MRRGRKKEVEKLHTSDLFSPVKKKTLKKTKTQEVIRTNLSVREGIEIIVSMGMALPKELVELT